MVRVSAGELQRQWGRIQDMALAEPVTVTSNGRDRMVLLSTEEYNRLKRRDREVRGLADFTDADITAIKKVKPSKAATAFDHELEHKRCFHSRCPAKSSATPICGKPNINAAKRKGSKTVPAQSFWW